MDNPGTVELPTGTAQVTNVLDQPQSLLSKIATEDVQSEGHRIDESTEQVANTSSLRQAIATGVAKADDDDDVLFVSSIPRRREQERTR